MVKDLLQDNEKNQGKKKVKTTKELATIQIRINKLQDLYVDGELDKSAYDQTMLRYNTEMLEKTELLGNLDAITSEYKDWLKKGIDLLGNIKKHYQRSGVEEKQQLLGSIFPEKIKFDGKQCRTGRINEVVSRILLIDNKLKGEKKGQFSKKMKLSRLVSLSVESSNFLKEDLRSLL